MIMRRFIYSCLLSVFLVSGVATNAAAEGRIGTVLAVPEKGGVMVSATLEGGFPKEIVAELRRGVPKDLFYTVTLKRRHRRFFDEEVAARSVGFTIKYDTLQSRYRIQQTDPDGKVTEREVPTYAEALSIVSRIDQVHINIPPGGKTGVLYASVKAEMRAVKLPMYLNYVLFFIPILEFETPWARSPNLQRVR